MAGRRCFIPVCSITQCSGGTGVRGSLTQCGGGVRGLELRTVRLLSCFRNIDKRLVITSKCVDIFTVGPKTIVYNPNICRYISSDASDKNPPAQSMFGLSGEDRNSDTKRAGPSEPGGEKVNYDRNFITAIRAMQDFLLKPG